MLLRRIYQFLIVYLLGVGLLFGIKLALNLSDYVIPGNRRRLAYRPGGTCPLPRRCAGHLCRGRHRPNSGPIAMALTVGIVGRRATWFGSFIKVAAYNIQAYPIVAIASHSFYPSGGWFSDPLVHRRHDLLLSAFAVHRRHHERTDRRYRAFLPGNRALALAVGN